MVLSIGGKGLDRAHRGTHDNKANTRSRILQSEIPCQSPRSQLMKGFLIFLGPVTVTSMLVQSF